MAKILKVIAVEECYLEMGWSYTCSNSTWFLKLWLCYVVKSNLKKMWYKDKAGYYSAIKRTK